MARSRIRELARLGQSVWYDYIRRDLYTGPELRRLIEEDGLRGMTSNPTIFEKGIAETSIYDDEILRLSGRMRPAGIFETIAVEDVQKAADQFRPLYEATRHGDGLVSIEVQPHLAHDAIGSIAEARRLFEACGRPNVMVKIPGTREGIGAIRQCLSEGININITLLFSIERYREVMDAYLAAMEERVLKGESVAGVQSVASFFVSRVDVNVDAKLASIAADPGRPETQRALARSLASKIAIHNARLAYEAFEEAFRHGARFAKLAEAGARMQRPLWASTSTKNPAYPELYYVEALVAPDTVDTMPPKTFQAYKMRGEPKVRIYDDRPGAHAALRDLEALGVDMKVVARELEEEGVRLFANSYDSLLTAVANMQRAFAGASPP